MRLKRKPLPQEKCMIIKAGTINRQQISFSFNVSIIENKTKTIK
jgi:hypothetical protein